MSNCRSTVSSATFLSNMSYCHLMLIFIQKWVDSPFSLRACLLRINLESNQIQDIWFDTSLHLLHCNLTDINYCINHDILYLYIVSANRYIDM